MKLLELRLQAFGPFTGRALDFSRPGALHLIYGPNEAGKSTTLRAITGLLYGIPATTLDAHLHGMPELRIGARLSDGNGTEIDVVRRKGNKNTLLSAADEKTALDEAVLQRLLGGVGESLFRSMFGLDHQSLRAGGEALLRGQGDVGESLFDAGVGGPGIHGVLEELRREADAIFTPRGQNPQLNQAIASYKAAEKRSRDDVVRAETWFTQQESLEASTGESESLLRQRPALVAEQARLQRALRVLPLLARRRGLLQQRAELGDVPALAADAAARRLAAQRDAEQLAPQIERLAAALAALYERRAALAIPDGFAALEEAAALDLQNRLGSHRAAAVDLPKRRAELLGLENEIRALLRDLGREAAEELEELRVPTALQARLRALAKQKSGLEIALANARDALADRQARLTSVQQTLAALPPAADGAALAAAVERARWAGDVEAQIDAASGRMQTLQRAAERKRAAVATLVRPSAEPGASLRSAGVSVSLEAIDTFAADLQALEREEAELRSRQRELHLRAARSQRAVEQLTLLGDIPTEEQLQAARARREALWGKLRARLERPADARPAADAYEPAVASADDLADRLRREAERAGTLAALQAAHHEVEEQQRLLEAERRDWSRRREAHGAAWSALWEAHAVEARSPAEMRAWLGEVAALAELEDQLAEAGSEMQRLEQRRAALAADIGAARGDREGEQQPGFPRLLHEAEIEVARRERIEDERQRLTKDAAELDGEVAGLERKVGVAAAAMERWQREWSAGVSALALASTASVDEAEAVLDKLGALATRLDESQRLRARVAAMERDADRLQQEVAGLVGAHAPDLAGVAFEEAADRLLRGHREAREKAQRRSDIDGDIDAKAAELEELTERRARAHDALRLLQREAGAASIDALEDIERRAAEAVRLARERQSAEDALLDAGEGASLDELVDMAHGVDPDTARDRLRDIAAELERIEERRHELSADIARTQAGLLNIEDRISAVEAAAEAQEHAAAIRGHVERYVRARLAVAILEQEIERYRQQNQGPILRRANELFPRLTLGVYRALDVGFDTSDEGVLLCLRADGTPVGVEGLSDGTRDQLYLALRLASLERYMKLNPGMPIVLDDILIHFDDDRARAALTVLGELAQSAQVLFFTHHARLLELAREAVPDRVEHRL